MHDLVSCCGASRGTILRFFDPVSAYNLGRACRRAMNCILLSARCSVNKKHRCPTCSLPLGMRETTSRWQLRSVTAIMETKAFRHFRFGPDKYYQRIARARRRRAEEDRLCPTQDCTFYPGPSGFCSRCSQRIPSGRIYALTN